MNQSLAIMLFALSSFFYQLFVLVLSFLFVYYVHFKFVGSKHWKKRNVFFEEPRFLLGNNWKMLFSENLGMLHAKRYSRYKEKKLIGFWTFASPLLMVTDIELIKRILVQDFNYFRDRPIGVNEKRDPLAAHLVNLKGSEWRNLRVKLTPTFTSGKMKMMYPIMVDCGTQLQKFLSKAADSGQTIEIKEVLARFTTDIISSCAFGIETNSINNPQSEFRSYGKKIFEPGLFFVSRFFLTSFFPRIREIFGVRAIPKEISDFFLKVVKETMEFREKNDVKRNDFMDLLIQLKNKGKVDDVDSIGRNEDDAVAKEQKFSVTQAAAQAFVFFAAGFETSSTTLGFAFYELAINPDVQAKLQQEIDLHTDKSKGHVTYEDIIKMEYLDRVVQETLRKYPPLMVLARKCTSDYEIPEMGVTIDEGTRVVISVYGLQRDPAFFPEPEKFDPDRFSPEEKAKRDHFTSLPFGEGPRNCIGLRFGLLQTKVGLVSVLSKFSVRASPETPVPLTFNRKTFILTSTTGIHVKLIKREDDEEKKNM